MDLTQPAFVSLHAPVDRVRTVLVGLGATAQDRRTSVLDLGELLLLLDHDPTVGLTTVAVGGPNAVATASWLALQLEPDCGPADVLAPAPSSQAG